MAKSILEIYDEMQSQLGVDTITYDAGVAKQTPYSLDDTKNADDQVLTAEKFKVGRGGQVNNVLYSSTIDRG
ncbi:hypothetical protein UFOVP449_76 [uncultured Caudovirales phage]|uniref:Uncharacterized protein n=1 Tax=uncultured Caudovirales phage TaxID=2100421 RepID=A0A6J5M7U8_9CAUD|nr:hypothetical protein UFOVP449_76 [uncultured Caudovirales phage]